MPLHVEISLHGTIRRSFRRWRRCGAAGTVTLALKTLVDRDRAGKKEQADEHRDT